MSRLYAMIVLALSIGVAGCGSDEDGDEGAAEVDASAVAGGAPIFVSPDERLPNLTVEPGYGWTVLHCRTVGQAEHCADASSMYGTVDGLLRYCDHVDARNGELDLCTGEALGRPRYVRLH